MWFIAKMKPLLTAQNVSPMNMGFLRKQQHPIKAGQELAKSIVQVLAELELIFSQYSKHSKQ